MCTLSSQLLQLLVAWLICLAERQGPHRMGIGRAATRQSTICLTVGMQVLLYPGKHISHADQKRQHLMHNLIQNKNFRNKKKQKKNKYSIIENNFNLSTIQKYLKKKYCTFFFVMQFFSQKIIQFQKKVFLFTFNLLILIKIYFINYLQIFSLKLFLWIYYKFVKNIFLL